MQGCACAAPPCEAARLFRCSQTAQTLLRSAPELLDKLPEALSCVGCLGLHEKLLACMSTQGRHRSDYRWAVLIVTAASHLLGWRRPLLEDMAALGDKSSWSALPSDEHNVAVMLSARALHSDMPVLL